MSSLTHGVRVVNHFTYHHSPRRTCVSMALPRRKLAGTGLELSVIGFGASPLGGVFQEIDENVGIAAVHRAFELGINFFDTSPFYGSTKSETVLGRALKGLPRSEIVLATKVGRYGPEDFDFSAERVTKCFDESLKRLQVDYVDILQCHDIEFADLDQIVNETLPALLELKRQGRVRHVGITGLPLKIYSTVLDKAPPGTCDVMLSYCHYCLNDDSLTTIIPYLQGVGVGIINASCLSMGLLTQQGPPDWHPAPLALKQACKEAAEAAKAPRTRHLSSGAHVGAAGILSTPRTTLGISAIIASRRERATASAENNQTNTLTTIRLIERQRSGQNDTIASTLVGMHTPELVEQNVKAAKEALGTIGNPGADAEEATLTEIKTILHPVMNTTWPSGLPQNN